MPFVSSRRCMVLLTTLLLFWIIFIGTIVSNPPRSLSAYTSKISFGGKASGATFARVGGGDGKTVPPEWLKDTRFLQGKEGQATLPPHQTALIKTPEVEDTHNEVFSKNTPDGSFFKIDFGDGHPGINPNIIPHPYDPNLWITVAQEFHGLPTDDKPVTPWSTEMVCNANFTPSGALLCTQPPSILPIASTPWSPHCPPELEVLNLNVGPHDARVFYGPGIPFTTFGSQSRHSCLGQFAQDFRHLVDWGMFRTAADLFPSATDLMRPPPSGPLEKNFFLFWALDGALHAHHDLHPRRVFAALRTDGSPGPDLAPAALPSDARCWRRHLAANPLPAQTAAQPSSIHQATNSLALSLCRRADPACVPTAENTFLLHIFQHKIYTGMFSARYEPFVALFGPAAPFALHAISEKPLWFHGRTGEGHMLYVTAVSWREHGLTYHGFLDDSLLVTFGVDDRGMGGVEVEAGELVKGMMGC